ncbi:unnamed protein product [Lota lota]
MVTQFTRSCPHVIGCKKRTSWNKLSCLKNMEVCSDALDISTCNYGQCLITVKLDAEEQGEEDVEYFLLFAGSTQRHLTSTLRASQDTLQALCPAHDCSETVQITLCCLRQAVSGAPEVQGSGTGCVAQLAQQCFCFVQDPTFDMAQFLVSTAGRVDGLEGALQLDECQISVEESERMDQALTRALQHLTLPPGWSLLGGRNRGGVELVPQETLLHFAARRGFTRVADFLLEQPAAGEALQLDNRQGHTPAELAELRGHTHLSGVLTHTDGGTDGGGAPDARVVCHLPDLNTHTLTVDTYPGREPPTIQHAVKLLRYWSRRLQTEGVSSLKLQSDWQWTQPGSVDRGDTEPTARTDRGGEEEEEGDRDPECSPEQPALGPGTNHRGSDGRIGPQDGSKENGGEEREKRQTEGREERERDRSKERGGKEREKRQTEGREERERDRSKERGGKEREKRQTEGREERERDRSKERGGKEREKRQTEGREERERDRSKERGGKEREKRQTEGREERERDGSKERGGEEREKRERDGSKERGGEEREEEAAEGRERRASVGEGTRGEAGSPPAAEEGEREADPEGRVTGADSGQVEDRTAPGGYRTDMGVNLSSQSSVTSDSAELPSEEGRPEEEGSDCDKWAIGDGVVMLEVTSEHSIGPSLETHTLQQKQETAAAGGSSCTEEEPFLSPSPPETGVGAVPDAAHPDPEHGEHLHSISGSLREAVVPEDPQGAEEEEEEETRGAEEEEETQGAEDVEKTRGAEKEEAHGAETPAGVVEARPGPEPESTTRTTVKAPPVCTQTPGSTKEEQNPGTEPVHLTIEEEEERGEADKTQPCQEMKTDVMVSASTTSPASQHGTTENPIPDPSLEERLEITEGSEVLMQKEPTKGRDSHRDSDSSSSDTSGQQNALEGSEVTDQEEDVRTTLHQENTGPFQLEESSEDRVDTGGSSSELLQESPPALETLGAAAMGSSAPHSTPGLVVVSGLNTVGSIRTEHSGSIRTEHSGSIRTEHSGSVRTEHSGSIRTEHSGSIRTEHSGSIRTEHSGRSTEHSGSISTEHSGIISTEHSGRSTEHSGIISTEHSGRSTEHSGSISTEHSGRSTEHSGSSHSPRGRSAGAYSDSVSDTDSFPGVETGNDSVFSKGEEVLTGGDSTSEVSLSSGDDPSSSPDSRLEPEAPRDSHWGHQDPGPAGPPGEADDEAKDRVTEVLLRPGRRSLSPPRRHSWGPGRNAAGPGSSCGADGDMNHRSYSLEGLSGEGGGAGDPSARGPGALTPPTRSWQEGEEGGDAARVSLCVEQGSHRRKAEEQVCCCKSKKFRPLRYSCPPMSLPLTKSVSMVALSQRDIDGMRTFSSASCSLAYSISEEDTGSLRSDSEGRSGTRVGRTFSYLKNKMTRKSREKEKKTVNGHVFSPTSSLQATLCVICNKALNAKDFFNCTHCNASVHKGCTEGLPPCLRVKMKQKQQLAFPDSASFPVVTLRNRAPGMRDRPWSAILSPDEHSSLGPLSRRPTSIMPFHGNHLSKSLSISNIAGPVFDDMSGPIKGLRYLSQSTDSLSRTKPVTESMESLIDEGTEMMEDRQLMGDLEGEVKELEADSWTFTVDQSILDTLTKDQTKRQDVIYELMQTEMHHVRTLRIMSEVYGKGLLKDAHLEQAAVDKMFPGLDDLLELHTLFLTLLLERRQRSGGPDSCEGGAVVHRVGDLLLGQFSGASGEEMKRVYGRFCGSHNEAVNFYKDLLNKDKRFQVSVKKKMSSSIVRRLGIPECILLVTQRITKYPVLIQRILQYTDESEEDHGELSQALSTVKEVIAAVDTRVNEQEKRRRLEDVHARMESKSIMRMRSGQMFAREDLLRGRRLLHEGALQLKNNQGRMKDVTALLLSDVFVFLQEKDQKYTFPSLDQRSTVLSLQNLIVREVANEERGIFLISAGADQPEMLEVVASSKEERNAWMQLIQNAMNAVDREDDEGIPSETEEDKRQMEKKFKEMREALRQRDVQIVSLLEEKVQLFREMCECGGAPGSGDAALFRASSGLQPPCGEPIIKDALREVETLQDLVNTTLGGLAPGVPGGGGVCLPRRAETFAGFDSRKIRVESQSTAVDLRRTGSDSVLKKGGNANLLILRRNSEQVLHSVYQLHHLLSTLQAVVVQQDSLLEDQRQTLGERSSSFSSLASLRPSSRPSSLIEQEKQRSVERRRQELASLHKEQAAHVEERRHREKEWDIREQQLTDREVVLRVQEEEASQLRQDLEEENQEFQLKKEQYQRDLERLRDAQRRLDRDREGVQRDLDRLAQRTTDPSSTSEDYQPPAPGGSSSSEQGVPEPWPRRESLVRLHAPAQLLPLAPSKPKGRNLNPFSGTSLRAGEGQVAGRLLQLTKNKDKEKREKKKKKGKVGGPQGTESQNLSEAHLEGEIFFC